MNNFARARDEYLGIFLWWELTGQEPLPGAGKLAGESANFIHQQGLAR